MKILAAVACKVIGHNDYDRTPHVKRGAPLVECARCGRIGWLIR